MITRKENHTLCALALKIQLGIQSVKCSMSCEMCKIFITWPLGGNFKMALGWPQCFQGWLHDISKTSTSPGWPLIVTGWPSGLQKDLAAWFQDDLRFSRMTSTDPGCPLLYENLDDTPPLLRINFSGPDLILHGFTTFLPILASTFEFLHSSKTTVPYFSHQCDEIFWNSLGWRLFALFSLIFVFCAHYIPTTQLY